MPLGFEAGGEKKGRGGKRTGGAVGGPHYLLGSAGNRTPLIKKEKRKGKGEGREKVPPSDGPRVLLPVGGVQKKKKKGKKEKRGKSEIVMSAPRRRSPVRGLEGRGRGRVR